ncbi:MAG: hypothetical protein AAGA11_09665 [Pseudomonadota bacterium]
MIVEWLHVLATVALGLYAGSLLTEGALLVPYWRTLSPSAFFGLHGDFGPRLFRFFFPVTNAAVWLSVASALLDRFDNAYRTVAAVLCLAALATFFLFFKRANAAFAARTLSDEALASALARWALWHWVRTVAAVLAFAAATAAFVLH